MSDIRLKNAPPAETAGDDARSDRSTANDTRVEDDGGSLTLAERRRLMRAEWEQEALPKLPQIPNWHLCWLSTTNSYDPISKRIRLGYRPVLTTELEGFDNFKMNSGEFEGCISCNEMVLFKLPQDLYQMYMEEFHHNLPMESEQVIKSEVEKLMGPDIVRSELGDGNQQLAAPAKVPVFEG